MKNFFDLIALSNSILIILGAFAGVLLVALIVGYKDLRRMFKELVLTCSGKDSLFSQKKIINWLAILLSSGMTVWYLRENITGMPIANFMWILSWWFAVSGYNLSQIQKEKFELPKDPTNKPAE